MGIGVVAGEIDALRDTVPRTAGRSGVHAYVARRSAITRDQTTGGNRPDANRASCASTSRASVAWSW
jgi:hypothetical protein